MIDLQLLGGLELLGPHLSPTARARRRHPMVLLALVAAAAPQPMSRDRIMAFLWPESDADRASNSLRQALHSLRRDLGEELFLTESTGRIRLDPDKVTVDLWTFRDAIARKAYTEAVAVHRGPFLDDIHVAQLPEFSHWVEAERALVQREYVAALDTLGREAEDAHRYDESVAWRRRQAVADPCSSRAALGLLRSLTAAGDRPGALAYATVHEDFLRAHLDVAPDPAVSEFVAFIRRNSPASAAISHRPSAASPSVADAPPERTSVRISKGVFGKFAGRRRRLARHALPFAFGIAAVGLLGAAASRAMVRGDAPVIVVASGADAGAAAAERDTADMLISCDGPACPAGKLPQAAFVVAKHDAYSAGPSGTHYIAPVRDGTTIAEPGYRCCSRAVFEHKFTLPADAATGTISIDVAADNQAIVTINGAEFGRQTDSLSQWNFDGPHTTFTTSFLPDPSGVNRLRVTLWDGGGVLGLNYRAIVKYDRVGHTEAPGR